MPRPKKYHTDKDRKAANAEKVRRHRQRQKASRLQVDVDADSVLGESSSHITAPELGIQAEGLDIPADEDLQVGISYSF
jgi:hypothetical protein